LRLRVLDSKYRSSAVWILTASLTVSILTLVFYLAEADFSDELLFRLLSVLRYSSFVVCICSGYLIASGIFSMIRNPKAATAFGIILFFIFALYGACIIVVDVLFISIAGGNG